MVRPRRPPTGPLPPPLSIPVDVSDLPSEGRPIRFAADEAARGRIARFTDAVSIATFAADGTVKPHGPGVMLELRLRADTAQACVVTLDPVPQLIDVNVRRHYIPAFEPEVPEPGAEILIDAGDDEPPEPLTGPHIDIGPVLVEEFVLALDPYPRAQGIAYAPEIEDSGAEESPFAALKALKTDGQP